jgi:MOSC domain-containing protein YiiM
LYTRSTHTGVGKPGSVKAMSAMGIRENFTVDGLPDGEVCIGDRYRIGSAVFEVTQR